MSPNPTPAPPPSPDDGEPGATSGPPPAQGTSEPSVDREEGSSDDPGGEAAGEAGVNSSHEPEAAGGGPRPRGPKQEGDLASQPRPLTPEEAEAWFAAQPRALSPGEAEAWFARHAPRAFTPAEAEAFFADHAKSSSDLVPPPSLPGLGAWARLRAALRLPSAPMAAAAGAPAPGAAPPPSPPAGGAPDVDFTRDLREALRRAPWMLLSLALHALLMAVLANMVWLTRPIPPDRSLHSEAIAEPFDPIPEPEPEEQPPELEDIPIEEPDVEVELAEEAEPAVEDMREALDAPFDTSGFEPLIGISGNAGGFRGKYRNRGRGGRGRSGTDRAVAAGLDWLHRHQQPDGSWDSDGFSARCAGKACPGPGGNTNDVGVSALALLAFLGSGNTAREGVYRENVRNGLRWMEKIQDGRSGCFGSRAGRHFIYGHALATLAMVEAYHLSEEPILRGPAQKGLAFIARSRNPYAAWRYSAPPNGDNDSSVTGWMLFALFAGRDAGLQVDDGAIRQGMAYLEKMTHPATFRTGYHSPGQRPLSSGEAMTAVSVLLRVFNGEKLNKSVAMRKGADLVVDCLPSWEQRDYYYWYYASYAMWQLSGTYWSRWQGAMIDAIVKNQVGGRSCQRGSWEPRGDHWGGQGGRVYSTALCTLSLQVYYRYDRVLGSR